MVIWQNNYSYYSYCNTETCKNIGMRWKEASCSSNQPKLGYFIFGSSTFRITFTPWHAPAWHLIGEFGFHLLITVISQLLKISNKIQMRHRFFYLWKFLLPGWWKRFLYAALLTYHVLLYDYVVLLLALGWKLDCCELTACVKGKTVSWGVCSIALCSEDFRLPSLQFLIEWEGGLNEEQYLSVYMLKGILVFVNGIG